MNFGADEFARAANVSRETLDHLTTYERLVRKWNPAINLVSKTTLENIWHRHFLDSAHVYEIASPKNCRWLDLGPGGGFPGAVVAILATEKSPNVTVTCIEADIRKCEFIRTVGRSTGTKIGVLSRRIEESPPHNASVVSARALAPLTKLLGYVHHHVAPDGFAVLHKGEHWQAEVTEALEKWRFSFEKHSSETNPGSVILKIGDLARA